MINAMAPRVIAVKTQATAIPAFVPVESCVLSCPDSVGTASAVLVGGVGVAGAFVLLKSPLELELELEIELGPDETREAESEESIVPSADVTWVYTDDASDTKNPTRSSVVALGADGPVGPSDVDIVPAQGVIASQAGKEG